MKKGRIFKALSILATIFTLAACAPSDIVEFSFKVLPNESYEACESEEDVKRRIIVTADGKDYSLKDLEEMGASISGLDFSTSGKHTLTVSYNGDSLSYEYEVVGDTIITGFEKAAEGIDLDNHSENYVFGFNKETGKVGLYDKTTFKLSGSNEIADDNVYFVASKEEDFAETSTNSYLVVNNITLSDALVFNHPVDLIATSKENAINGDVTLDSDDKVNVKIDTNIYGTLTINTPNGHIEHHGQAERIVVDAVSEHTFDGHGIVGELVLGADAGNCVIEPDGIVYSLVTADMPEGNTITNKGIIYAFDERHVINNTANGFIFSSAVANSNGTSESAETFNIPNGTLKIKNYKVTEVNLTITSADQLMWFTYLTQSGKSPLIQDQPLVTVNIPKDGDKNITIDMDGKNWIPVANWNFWANGVANRWFTTTEASGWENYCNGDADYDNHAWDFISNDEMYTNAFYNDCYKYTGNSYNVKITPIYYIRLVINGNGNTISNLDNAFLGCVSYGTSINNLNINYNYEAKNIDSEQTHIWNNLNGINIPGYLDTEVNTHFGLFCNNIYVPAKSDGSPAGTVEFNSIALGGKFIYRNCRSKFTAANGSFVAGAFASNVAINANNKDLAADKKAVLKFANCSLQEGLDFLITKKVGSDVEKTCQWPNGGKTYSEGDSSNNYAMLADYCCGTGGTAASYCNFINDASVIKTIGGLNINKTSNYQGGFGKDNSINHECSHGNQDTKIVVDNSCTHGNICVKYCKDCGKQIGDYYTDTVLRPHNYTLNTNSSFTLVESEDDIEPGDTIIFAATNAAYVSGNESISTSYVDGLYVKNLHYNNKKTFAVTETILGKFELYNVIEGLADNSYAFVNSRGKVLIGSKQDKTTDLNENMGNLRTQYTVTNNSSWTIDIDETTKAATVTSCDSTDKGMYYNTLAYFTKATSKTNYRRFYVVNDGYSLSTTGELQTICIYKLDANPKENASCIKCGINAAYYHCADCDNYYTLVNNNWVLTRYDDLKTNMTEHKITYIDAVEATCEHDGNIKYGQCSKCGLYYDKDGNVIEENSWLISQLEHNIEYVPESSATCTEDGYHEHYMCTSGCGKHFSDEDGTNEITDNSWQNGTALSHDWQEVVDDKYLKSAATLTSPAVYYKNCSHDGCTEHKNNETFTYGDAITTLGLEDIGSYNKITNTNQLNDGDFIIITNSSATYAKGLQLKGSNSAKKLTKTNEIIYQTALDEYQIYQVVLIDNNYVFKTYYGDSTASKYLYAREGSTYFLLTTSLKNSCYWNIVFNESGCANISNKNDTPMYLTYNSTSTNFSATQSSDLYTLCIYKYTPVSFTVRTANNNVETLTYNSITNIYTNSNNKVVQVSKNYTKANVSTTLATNDQIILVSSVYNDKYYAVAGNGHADISEVTLNADNTVNINLSGQKSVEEFLVTKVDGGYYLQYQINKKGYYIFSVDSKNYIGYSSTARLISIDFYEAGTTIKTTDNSGTRYIYFGKFNDDEDVCFYRKPYIKGENKTIFVYVLTYTVTEVTTD